MCDPFVLPLFGSDVWARVDFMCPGGPPGGGNEAPDAGGGAVPRVHSLAGDSRGRGLPHEGRSVPHR